VTSPRQLLRSGKDLLAQLGTNVFPEHLERELTLRAPRQKHLAGATLAKTPNRLIRMQVCPTHSGGLLSKGRAIMQILDLAAFYYFSRRRDGVCR